MEDIISSDTATWSLHEYPSGLCCCGVRRSGQSLCKPAKIAFFFVNIQQQCIVALDKEITEVNHNTLVNDESSVEVSTWCADIPHERSAPSVVTLWSLKAVRSANTGQLFISISKETARQVVKHVLQRLHSHDAELRSCFISAQRPFRPSDGTERASQSPQSGEEVSVHLARMRSLLRLSAQCATAHSRGAHRREALCL